MFKMSGKKKVLKQTAGRALLFAPLLTIATFAASVASAQSDARTLAAPEAAPAIAAQKPAQAAMAPTPEAQPDKSSEEKPAGKGAHEGIKIHGHWTIDVRNPDGTLAKHLDFENGLCTLSSLHLPPGSIAVAGDFDLAALLFGNVVPGPWQIVLASPEIPAFPTGGSPGPACGSLAATSDAFTLNQSNATGLDSTCTVVKLCFPVLTPPVLTASENGILLVGQFTVPLGTANTTITAVQTKFAVCQVSEFSTSAACVANFGALSPFSGTYLTGIGAVPSPPTVSAGQTVAVSVQYSFQ